MKYIDEYRDAGRARQTASAIRSRVTRPWVLMEICGGQTHTIMRYGLPDLLPPTLEFVHGPGCPVCVTPLEVIDAAIEIAARREVIMACYGDMMRVPGSHTDLLRARAAGADVRIVYSPTDALQLARRNPAREIVFFAIGFETTAPPNAMAVWLARREGLKNFSMLGSHVRVPPAVRLILGSEGNRVNGLIAPGHVCTIMGLEEYEELSREFRIPIVAGGFEPLDVLEATRMLVCQLEEGRFEVENEYGRCLSRDGNPAARKILAEVFEIADRKWRGIGVIPKGGFAVRQEFAAWDAARRFDVADRDVPEPAECKSALVLQGRLKPTECPAFGKQCTPQAPLGAPMVSSEGACAAWYQFKGRAS
uniref:Hydrogenase expression/formation protein HypD n=1 Tax=Solibacter usitatus (strain Ellin6076) TaxID=234267 RepID=Q01R78_SOLUE